MDPISIAVNLEADFEDVLVATAKLDSQMADIAVKASESFERAAGDAYSYVNAIEEAVKAQERGLIIAAQVTRLGGERMQALQGELLTGSDSLTNYEQEEEFLKSFKGLIKDYIKHIEFKNKLHELEVEYVGDELKKVTELTDESGRRKETEQKITDILAQQLAKAGEMLRLLVEVDKSSERFKETNYRAYGTQQQLVNATRSLSAELGVAAEESVEIYKSLADMKTPREQMDKLAKTIAVASRTTGVGVGQLASFTRSLRAVGFDAEATQIQITKMTEAMRKYGLTQDDINTLMGTSTEDMMQIQSILGGSTEEMAAFQDTMLGLAGVAKEMGLTAREAEAMQRRLSDPTSWAVLGGMTGMAINNTQDLNKAFLRGGQQLAKLQQRIADTAAAGGDVTSLNLEFNALSEAMFGSATSGRVMTEQYKKVNQIAKDNNISMEEALKKYRELNTAVDHWTESINTLYKQYNILRESVNAAFNAVAQFAADGVGYALYYINGLVTRISKLIVIVMQMMDAWEKSSAVGYVVIGFLKLLVGFLVLSGIALTTVIGAISSLAMLFGGMSRVVTGAIDIIERLTRAVLRLAVAFARAMVRIAGAIAESIRVIGSAAADNARGILVLAAAAVALGVGIYFAAKGIEIFVDLGWQSVGMLLAVVAVFSAFLLVITLLGKIAGDPRAALGIGVLSIALVALGLAAMMAGAGVYMISQALVAIADIPFMTIFTGIAGLSLAIIMLGGALLLAAPGLNAGGFALLAVGAAAYLVALAFDVFVTALGRMNEYLTPQLGTNLKLVGEGLGELGWAATKGTIGLGALAISLPRIASAAPGLAAFADAFGKLIPTLQTFMSMEGLVDALDKFVIVIGDLISNLSDGWFTSDPVAPIERLAAAFASLGAATVVISSNLANAVAAIEKVIAMPMDTVEANLGKLKNVLNLSLNEIASAKGWAVLGKAMESVGNSMKGLGEGFKYIVEAMDKMSADNLNDFAENFKNFAVIMQNSVSSALKAGTALSVIGDALLPGAKKFSEAASYIFTGGENYKKGSEMIAAGTKSLDSMGDKMAVAGKNLLIGTKIINAGWSEFRSAAQSLCYSGDWLDDAGEKIAKGLNAISSAAETFKKSSDAFRKMKDTLVGIHQAIEDLIKLDVDKFVDIFKKLNKASGDVKRFADAINKVSITATHDNIVVPLYDIANALTTLTDAMIKAQEVADKQDQEGKADTLNEIKVMLADETIDELTMKQNAIAQLHLDAFVILKEFLMDPKREENIVFIRNLLNEWLPEIARKSVMGSEFNAWAR